MSDSMERPYTEQQVFEVELAADDIGVMLHNPYATGLDGWRAIDPKTLSDLFYDALIALRNEMTMEDD